MKQWLCSTEFEPHGVDQSAYQSIKPMKSHDGISLAKRPEYIAQHRDLKTILTTGAYVFTCTNVNCKRVRTCMRACDEILQHFTLRQQAFQSRYTPAKS